MIELDVQLMKCSLFHGLESNVITEVLSQSATNKYETGAVLIKKGAVPEALFIVQSGKVSIYNEDILLAELGPLSIMGESFLANATTTATIVAASALTTIEIKKDLFYKLAMKYPALVFNIFNINFQRLRTSNESALKEARAREEKLEKQVTQRTKELNDTLGELRVTNKELSITRDSLIETQKFRDQFLANMSHEIRTPMNAIMGLTNLLVKSPLNELQEKYMNVIKKSGQNLLVIINDILDLAKIEAGKMELESVPFPLLVAVNNIHTILSMKAEEKGIAMKEVIGEGVPQFVIGDETRISQVVMNLAGNAIKFTEKGGVTIAVTVQKMNEESVDLKFSVTDTGIGIPENKIDKIFESFGQASTDTTRKFGGTGLGLTISKQLVEMHGSELKVKSTPGEGSEFYFIVTYKIAAKPQEALHDDLSVSEDMKGKRILLVEDNEFNQMVAVDTLQDMFPGIEIDIAETGKIAIEKASGNDYNFIFMDIQLPDLDGFEITRFIRANLPEPRRSIRICAMTASVTKEKIDECFEAGMDDYLMKPFSPELLKEKVIRNALGK